MIDEQGPGPFGRIKSTFASLPTPHQRDRALSLLQLNIIRRQSVLSYRVRIQVSCTHARLHGNSDTGPSALVCGGFALSRP